MAAPSPPPPSPTLRGRCAARRRVSWIRSEDTRSLYFARNKAEAMELANDEMSDMEEENTDLQYGDEDLTSLPEEWVYAFSEAEKGNKVLNKVENSKGDQGAQNLDMTVKTVEMKTVGDSSIVPVCTGLKKRVQEWGPNIVARRSKRQPRDGQSILERAQKLKAQANLEIPKGQMLERHEDTSLKDSGYAASLVPTVSKREEAFVLSKTEAIEDSGAEATRVAELLKSQNNWDRFMFEEANNWGSVLVPEDVKLKLSGAKLDPEDLANLSNRV